MARPTSVLLIAIVSAGLGFAAALALGSGPAAADPELMLLIRFMAVLKAGMALLGMALAAWRLRYPASTRMAAGYVVAVALMAGAPGLIWEMSHIVAGAVVFHAGLGIFLTCAWADRELATEMFARRVPSRKHFHGRASTAFPTHAS
jgi:hypothetical protein